MKPFFEAVSRFFVPGSWAGREPNKGSLRSTNQLQSIARNISGLSRCVLWFGRLSQPFPPRVNTQVPKDSRLTFALRSSCCQRAIGSENVEHIRKTPQFPNKQELDFGGVESERQRKDYQLWPLKVRVFRIRS